MLVIVTLKPFLSTPETIKRVHRENGETISLVRVNFIEKPGIGVSKKRVDYDDKGVYSYRIVY